MDANWLDTLTKTVSRPGASRRGVVRSAVAVAVGGVLLSLGQASAADKVSAENCTPEGKRCGKGKRQQPCKKCCTRNVITDQKGKRRCSCVRLGNGCSNDSQCCEGICLDGICRIEGPVCLALQSTCTAGDTCCAGVCDALLNVCCIEFQQAGCTVDADCCTQTASCYQGACENL